MSKLFKKSVNAFRYLQCSPTYKQFVLTLAWIEELRLLYQEHEEEENPGI